MDCGKPPPWRARDGLDARASTAGWSKTPKLFVDQSLLSTRLTSAYNTAQSNPRQRDLAASCAIGIPSAKPTWSLALLAFPNFTSFYIITTHDPRTRPYIHTQLSRPRLAHTPYRFNV